MLTGMYFRGSVSVGNILVWWAEFIRGTKHERLIFSDIYWSVVQEDETITDDSKKALVSRG